MKIGFFRYDRYSRKVILVKRDRKPQKPLTAYFGAVSLKWNKWVSPSEQLTTPIWSQRSELVERLKAQKCELCGAQNQIEVHHVRKLADIEKKGEAKPEWKKRMQAYSGLEKPKSLEIYSKLAIEDCQKVYEDKIKDFPI